MINIPRIIKLQGNIESYTNQTKTTIYVKDDNNQIYFCYTSKKVNLGRPLDKVNIIGEELNNNKIRINYIENTTINLTHYLIYKKINKNINISLISVLILINLFVIVRIGSNNWFETNDMTMIITLFIYMGSPPTILFLVIFMINSIQRKNQKRRYIENMKNLEFDRNIP